MARTQRKQWLLTGITVERLMGLLRKVGFSVDTLTTMEDEVEHPPIIRCERFEITTFVQMKDDVDGDRNYATLEFSAQMPADGAIWDFWYNDPDSLPRDTPKFTIKRTLRFGKGVPLEWLELRIMEWDSDLVSERIALHIRSKAPGDGPVH